MFIIQIVSQYYDSNTSETQNNSIPMDFDSFEPATPEAPEIMEFFEPDTPDYNDYEEMDRSPDISVQTSSKPNRSTVSFNLDMSHDQPEKLLEE